MRFVNPGGRIVQALKNPGTFTVSIRSTWNVFDRLLSKTIFIDGELEVLDTTQWFPKCPSEDFASHLRRLRVAGCAG
jgi:hypothetical protein